MIVTSLSPQAVLALLGTASDTEVAKAETGGVGGITGAKSVLDARLYGLSKREFATAGCRSLKNDLSTAKHCGILTVCVLEIGISVGKQVLLQ